MPSIGRYCKAYLLKKLRVYVDWDENVLNARPEDDEDGTSVDREDGAGPRTLTDESVVYVQEDFTVTDDIYLDEYVLFDHITPKWEEFCRTELEFMIPDDVLAMYAEEEPESANKDVSAQ